MNFEVVDLLTGSYSMAVRPFVDQPHGLDRIGNNYFHLGQAIKSGKFEGILAIKGPARVLSWSKLVIFRSESSSITRAGD